MRSPSPKKGRGFLIKATKLNNEEIVINAELIETLEATPDTHVNLTTGKSLIVCETVDEIIEKIIVYRSKIRLIDRID